MYRNHGGFFQKAASSRILINYREEAASKIWVQCGFESYRGHRTHQSGSGAGGMLGVGLGVSVVESISDMAAEKTTEPTKYFTDEELQVAGGLERFCQYTQFEVQAYRRRCRRRTKTA